VKRFIVTCLIILLFIIPAVPLAESIHPPMTTLQIIQRAAEKYELDWRLVVAVAVVESDFDPKATSQVGAKGLMQVMDVHLQGTNLQPNALYDPKINVIIGCRYLADLISRFGEDAALQIYNLGETRYKRGVRARRYLNKVQTVHKGIMVVAQDPRPFGEGKQKTQSQ
jgi:soluble lytic murein transglycosylase